MIFSTFVTLKKSWENWGTANNIIVLLTWTNRVEDLADMGWFFSQKVLLLHLETSELCLISWNMARRCNLSDYILCFLPLPLNPQLRHAKVAQKNWLNLYYTVRKTAKIPPKMMAMRRNCHFHPSFWCF